MMMPNIFDFISTYDYINISHHKLFFLIDDDNIDSFQYNMKKIVFFRTFKTAICTINRRTIIPRTFIIPRVFIITSNDYNNHNTDDQKFNINNLNSITSDETIHTIGDTDLTRYPSHYFT